MKQLIKIYSKVNELVKYTTTDNTNQAKIATVLKDIETLANTMLGKHDKNVDIKQVVQTHQAYLFKIHDVLVGKFAKLYMSPDLLVKTRKIHDKIFNIFNIKQPRKRFAHLPTFLATTFCKGVTFFANDTGIDRKPYYHRDDSCGSFDKQKKSLTKEQLKTCYIERLIYDKIFTHVFYEQDLGHLYELRAMELLFQDAYKHLKIDVDIGFSDGIHPDTLTIIERYTETTPKYTTYVYNKRWGSTTVYCHKYEDGLKYSKVQTYEHEEAFLASP
jgi:hypothetical protein